MTSANPNNQSNEVENNLQEIKSDIDKIKKQKIPELEQKIEKLNSFRDYIKGIPGIIIASIVGVILGGSLLALWQGILSYENRLTKLETRIDDQITKLNTTVESKVKELDQLKAQVKTVNTKVERLTGETTFPMVGWSSSGGLQVTPDATNQRVTFSGQFTSAAGYVKEQPSGFSFGGRILTLNIQNSAQSSFNQNKMFKLEANGIALQPQENNRINSNDSQFINAGDGTVSFQLPDRITKLEFVFFDANLNNLEISGTLSNSR